MTNSNKKISVVLPCRNEEESLDSCLQNIKAVFLTNNLIGEIIVSDSSIDNSPIIAKNHNVKLIKHDLEGYGLAYLEGFKAVTGDYIFIADPDNTYDFKEIPRFIEQLDAGYDFVIGNRFQRGLKKGVMPWSHKYIGNPTLSFLFRLFFKAKIIDVHCGMRAFTKQSLDKLNLQTTGMEFASEMIIKAIKNNLKIKELPIDYHKRSGESKLKTFSDGWRHLRFMLIYSPLYLFFVPGLIMFLIGLITMIVIYLNAFIILGIKLQYHPMFLSALLMITGYQLIIFSLFSKTYAITHLKEPSQTMDKLYKYITIEKGIIIGMIASLAGAIIYIIIFIKWLQNGFGELSEMKNSILALTLIIFGIQTAFSSFVLSILSIKEK